jgi:DNA-directed RNA polymerase subunit RPC12/RpoP
LSEKISIYKIVMFEWKCLKCGRENISKPTLDKVVCECCGKTYSVDDEAFIA